MDKVGEIKVFAKYRAWLKKENKRVKVLSIDFEARTIAYFNGVSRTYVSFDDCILMQSTGLKDKNGVEIYAGDKVIHVSFPNDPRIVEYHDGAYWVGDILLSTYHSSVIEIIGNKFEGMKGGDLASLIEKRHQEGRCYKIEDQQIDLKRINTKGSDQ